MTCAELYEWMADPSLLTKSSLQELRQMMDEYPYFHAVRMLYLKNLAVLQDVRLEKELKKMAIFIPHRRLLYTLINERPPAVGMSEMPELPTDEKDKTEIVFDVVEKALPAGEPDEKDFVSTLMPKPISPVAATSDYANWLAQNAEDLPTTDGTGNRLKHQNLIDTFIAIESNQLAQRLSNTVASKTSEPADEDALPPLENLEKTSLDDSYFTETLAQVYIRQKRYDKALEIIRVLSLKYPKKNRYFADQIRYLEKIINIKK
jgi:hypothetical protein